MAGNGSNAGFEVLISSDSHVMEPPDTLKERVAPAFREQAPAFPKLQVGESFQTHPGGSDPNYRIKEMETDGLSAEVLYPTYLLPHFAMDDGKLQAACFRAYNDWLIDYCKVAPKRLIGIAAISVYDIDEAVKELERCAKAGLRGSIIWQAPHPDLPFHSEHYNKFWAASQDLNMPVNLHILTGHGYHKETVFGNKRTGVEAYRGSVNLKLKEIIDAFFEMGVEPSRVVKLSGIGCSSKSPAYFLGSSHGFNAVNMPWTMGQPTRSGVRKLPAKTIAPLG